eukprot:Rmarinus@m.12014
MALHGENASPGTGMDEPKSPSGGIGLLGFLRALKLGFVRPGPVGTEFHEQAPGFNFFDEVPYDMMVYIFSFLDIRSLCAVARVQRTWYSAANDPALWKSLCLKECQYCTPARAGCRNWKHLYEKWARQTNRVYALELLWSSIGNRTTHFPTGTISYWREHGFGNVRYTYLCLGIKLQILFPLNPPLPLSIPICMNSCSCYSRLASGCKYNSYVQSNISKLSFTPTLVELRHSGHQCDADKRSVPLHKS